MEHLGDISFNFGGEKAIHAAIEEGIRKAEIVILTEGAAGVIDQITVNNQVDTGAMRASPYIETGEHAKTEIPNREESIAKGKELASHPGVKSGKPHDFNEEMDITWRPRRLQGKLALSADYAKYQEDLIPFLAPTFDDLNSRAQGIANDIIKKELGR